MRSNTRRQQVLCCDGRVTRAAAWRMFEDTRRTFPHADRVQQCLVFNIKGNDYRLITRIDYVLQTVTLKKFLTHAEYDRGK